MRPLTTMGRRLPRKRWLLLLPLLSALLVMLIGGFLPPTYSAQVQIAIRTSPRLTADDAGVATALRSPALYGGLLQSRRVAERVVAHFGLREVYGEDTLAGTLKQLQKRVRMGSRSGLVVIEADDRYPWRAADIANRYVLELQTLLDELKAESQRQRIIGLERELASLSEPLAAAQRTLETGGLDAASMHLLPEPARGRYAGLREQLRRAELLATMLQTRYADAALEPTLQRLRIRALRKLVAESEQAQSHSDLPEAGGYALAQREFRRMEERQRRLRQELVKAKTEQGYRNETLFVVDRAQMPERRSGPRTLLAMVGAALLTLAWQLRAVWLSALRARVARSAASGRYLAEGVAPRALGRIERTIGARQ